MKHRLFRITIKITALVAWLTIIFGFSSESGDNSSLRSGSILVSIVNFLSPSTKATMDNYRYLPSLHNSERILRKCAHMFEYGVLAFLALLLLIEIRKLKESIIPVEVVAEIFVLIIGSLDEINQTRIIDRLGSPVDVLIDGLGAMTVLVICYFVRRRKADKA